MSLKAKLKSGSHIFIATILALVAGLLIYYYSHINTPTKKVIVAATRLSIGTTVTPDMVQYDTRPIAKLADDAITKPEDVIGKTVSFGVLENEVIRKANLTAGKGGLAVRLTTLAPGRVATDLPLEAAPGLSGMNIGDHLDIYSEVVVADPAGKTGANMTVAVAQDAILIGTPSISNDKQQPGQSEKGTYIVAVKPEEKKNFAESSVHGKKYKVFLLPPQGGQQ